MKLFFTAKSSPNPNEVIHTHIQEIDRYLSKSNTYEDSEISNLITKVKNISKQLKGQFDESLRQQLKWRVDILRRRLGEEKSEKNSCSLEELKTKIDTWVKTKLWFQSP